MNSKGWVSVNDSLPEKEGLYLVKFEPTPFNKDGVGINEFTRKTSPHFTIERISSNKVTHWHEIPQ